MLAPLQAVIGDIRTSLGMVPLYTQRAKLNGDNPAPPYALLLPVSTPADPDRYDGVLVAGLNVWGSLGQVSDIAASLDWLDGYQIGVYGSIQNIRYTKQSGPISIEPEVMMPDGKTEMWNWSPTYRCAFAHFPGGGP